MSKFGEIINTKIPVLISFYADWEESYEQEYIIIRNVAKALGDRAKVVRIDVEKNTELTSFMRIKSLPTFMIYKNGQMLWRQSEVLDANAIISSVEKYI